MDDGLMDQLLNEDESSSLDFKLEQYPFAGATDDQKSEILKDILAFANAWRRTDAYVLIGVEEVRGGRSEHCSWRSQPPKRVRPSAIRKQQDQSTRWFLISRLPS